MRVLGAAATRTATFRACQHHCPSVDTHHGNDLSSVDFLGINPGLERDVVRWSEHGIKRRRKQRIVSIESHHSWALLRRRTWRERWRRTWCIINQSSKFSVVSLIVPNQRQLRFGIKRHICCPRLIVVVDCVILRDNADAAAPVEFEVIHKMRQIRVPREEQLIVMSLDVCLRHRRLPQLELVDVTLEMPAVIHFCFASAGTGEILPAKAMTEM